MNLIIDIHSLDYINTIFFQVKAFGITNKMPRYI